MKRFTCLSVACSLMSLLSGTALAAEQLKARDEAVALDLELAAPSSIVQPSGALLNTSGEASKEDSPLTSFIVAHPIADVLNQAAPRFAIVSSFAHEWNALSMFEPALRDEANSDAAEGEAAESEDPESETAYVYLSALNQPLPGAIIIGRKLESLRFGASDALSYQLSDELSLNGSYEFATRLPDPSETDGDYGLIQANPELAPEVSRHLTIGSTLDWSDSPVGDWSGLVNAAYRDTDNAVVLLIDDGGFTYQNVGRAVTLSAEASLAWTSPGGYLSLDWSGSVSDARNRSDDGAFSEYEGERLPGSAPFAANWGARTAIGGVFTKSDRIEPFYQGAFNSTFRRGWESQIFRELEQLEATVEAELVHSIGITHSFELPGASISNTFEIQNLTDEKFFAWQLVAELD